MALSLKETTKNNIFDGMFILLITISLGILFIFCYMAISQFSSHLPSGTLNQTVIDVGKSSMLMLDYVVFGILIGLTIFSVVSAYFIRTHPIFLAGGLLFLLVGIFITGLVSDVTYDITHNAFISPYANAFPLTMLIFQYLPIIFIVITIMILVALFGKGGQSANF